MSHGRGGAAGKVNHSGNKSGYWSNREMKKIDTKREAVEGPIIIDTGGAGVAIITRMIQGRRQRKLKSQGLVAAAEVTRNTGVGLGRVKEAELLRPH